MQGTKGKGRSESTSERLARIEARGYANLEEWDARNQASDEVEPDPSKLEVAQSALDTPTRLGG
jgi:hypothetical protein